MLLARRGCLPLSVSEVPWAYQLYADRPLPALAERRAGEGVSLVSRGHGTWGRRGAQVQTYLAGYVIRIDDGGRGGGWDDGMYTIAVSEWYLFLARVLGAESKQISTSHGKVGAKTARMRC